MAALTRCPGDVATELQFVVGKKLPKSLMRVSALRAELHDLHVQAVPLFRLADLAGALATRTILAFGCGPWAEMRACDDRREVGDEAGGHEQRPYPFELWQFEGVLGGIEQEKQQQLGAAALVAARA